MPYTQSNDTGKSVFPDCEVKNSSNFIGIILIITSATGFSTLAILGKIAYAEGFNLPSILAFRFAGATILLWPWLLFHNMWRLTISQAIKATLLGAIGFAIQAAVFFSALIYTNAGTATLLFYTYPTFVTILAWVREKEKPNLYRRIALILAILGCILTVDISGASVQPLGVTFGMASGLWYALYLTFGARLVQSIAPVVASAYLSLGATLSFLITALLTSGIVVPKSVAGIWVIAGIAVIATALPIVTLFAGIRRMGTTKAAIISGIEPVMTVLLGIVFLGERLEESQFLGCLLVVTSVVIANWERSTNL